MQLNSPPLGSSCGTVSPDSREECCLTKLNDNTQDDWCQQNYPDVRLGAKGHRQRRCECQQL